MSIMIKLSLLLNLAVLIPICIGFVNDASWVREAYGAATPARGILFAMYLSIMLGSLALLFFHEPQYVAALLAIQILYKLISPITVGSIGHPVVISNLAIALFHAVTLWIILNQSRGSTA